MYTLFTDTDTDITPELAKKYGYKLISMPYRIGDEEIYPYVDFETFDYHKFYDLLRSGVLPTTSGLSPQQYIDYFEPEFKKGNDVLYVHFSGAMSGTFDAMRIAINDLEERYPGRKVYTVDTLGITLGSYIICLEIGEMHLKGASIEDILQWADDEVQKYAVYFYADDLKFFAKSGRVSGLAAFFGGIIGIKPILTMNSEGKMVTHGKVRGRMNTLNRLVELVSELEDNIKDHRVVITHADCKDLALTLGGMIKDKFGNDIKIEYGVVNPTAGSHCGPDTLGIGFHAIHR